MGSRRVEHNWATKYTHTRPIRLTSSLYYTHAHKKLFWGPLAHQSRNKREKPFSATEAAGGSQTAHITPASSHPVTVLPLPTAFCPQVPAAARRPLASLSLQGHSPLQTSQPACTAFLASAPPRNPSLCSFLGSSKTSSSFLRQGLCKSCSYFVLLHRHQHTHRLAPSCPPEAHPRHHLPGEAFSRPPDKRPLVTLEPFLLQHSAGSLSVSKFLSIVYRIFSTKVKSLLCCSSQLPKLPGQRLKHGSGSAHICWPNEW